MRAPVDLAVDLRARYMVGEISGDVWIRAFFAIGDVHEEAFCFNFEALDALAEGVVLFGMSMN